MSTQVSCSVVPSDLADGSPDRVTLKQSSQDTWALGSP